jgi:RNA polymerase sigma factor (sigma-70 family)
MNASAQINDQLLNQMVNYVRKHLAHSVMDPRDVVHEAYLRSISALKKKSPPETPNSAYLWKALKSTIVDYIRIKERGLSSHLIYEPNLSDNPDIYNYLGVLTPQEREIFLLGHKKVKELKWSEIEKNTGVKSVNLRKRYSRALQRILTELIVQLYQEGRYEKINNYRLSKSIMESVATRFLQKDIPTSCLEHAFHYENKNRTIQNATWALVSMATKKLEAAKFLERQLLSSNLFRGNKTYIAEALIGLDSSHYASLLRKHYLPCLVDMNSRVTGTSLPFREQIPIRSRCLVDVIKYRPVGPEIPAVEVEMLRKQFMRGTSDVDLHRTIAWMLLRIMSNECKGIQTVVNSMVDEEDQTNAYYVTKFIMGPGLRMFPNILLKKETLNILRTVKFRWPQNFYFTQSAAHLSMKLKQINN